VAKERLSGLQKAILSLLVFLIDVSREFNRTRGKFNNLSPSKARAYKHYDDNYFVAQRIDTTIQYVKYELLRKDILKNYYKIDYRGSIPAAVLVSFYRSMNTLQRKGLIEIDDRFVDNRLTKVVRLTPQGL
jgi:hypothetical protein